MPIFLPDKLFLLSMHLKKERKRERKVNIEITLNYYLFILLSFYMAYRFILQLVALLIISINSHKRFYQYGGYFTYFAKIIWVQSHVQRVLSSASLQQACLLMLYYRISFVPINFSKKVFCLITCYMVFWQV